MEERSIGMEVNDVRINEFPPEEFKDNDTLQRYIDELKAAGVV